MRLLFMFDLPFLDLYLLFMSLSKVGAVYPHIGSFVGGFIRRVPIVAVIVSFFCSFSSESTLLICKECSLTHFLSDFVLKVYQEDYETILCPHACPSKDPSIP